MHQQDMWEEHAKVAKSREAKNDQPVGNLTSEERMVATVGLNEMAERNLLNTMRIASGLCASSSSAMSEA